MTPRCLRPSLTIPELKRLHSRTDRKRIRLLHDMLTEGSPYWDGLDDVHRQDGLDVIEILAAW